MSTKLSRRVGLVTASFLPVLLLALLFALPIGSVRGSGFGQTCTSQSGATANDPQAATSPNILLITIDTLRADYVGAFGNSWIHTPTLDALVRQGAAFSRHVSQFPQTNPSHASILTGVYPSTHGLKHHFVDHISAGIPTLAGALAAKGYTTVGIFSWPSFEPQYSGLDRGFTTYEGAYVPVPGETYIERAFDGKADATTDAALKWLGNRSASPFFLWIHYDDPHFTYTPPEPYSWIYDSCSTCIDGSWETIDGIVNGAVLFDWDLQHLKALYAGEISFTDQEIGRLLGEMRRAGQLDNTVIVVTSDHGESFNENGKWFHPSILYDTVIHVPLIVVYPPVVAPGSVVSAVTRSIDIMPTLLNLAGVALPDNLEGRDLLALLNGQEGGDQRVAFAETHDEASTAIVSKGWKLIRDNTNGALQLFDLQADPGETNDLAATNGQMAADLEAQLTDYMDAHGITYTGRSEGWQGD